MIFNKFKKSVGQISFRKDVSFNTKTNYLSGVNLPMNLGFIE